jgi:hypothetical protein
MLKGGLELTPPSLSLIAAAIADGRRDFDIWNAPGELSPAALVGSAEQDPRRSLRELLAESLEASSPSDAALDTFSLRRLAMRAKRYARAAAIIEEFCAARETALETVPPGLPERRAAPERRIESIRPWGRRWDDQVGHHVVRSVALPSAL